MGDESESEQSIWSISALHGVLLPPVLREFGKGLRTAFWGAVLMSVGLAAYGLSVLKLGANVETPLVMIAALFALGGVLLTTWSKQQCFNFAAPISGRWAISLAFWLDVTAIGLRFAGRQLGFKAGARLFAVLCLVASLFFFLLFLERLSRLIARSDLQRSVWLVFVCAAAACVLPLTPLMLIRMDVRFPWMLTASSSAAIVLAVTGLYIYLRLLWSLSSALFSFADYLDRQLDSESDEGDEEDDRHGELSNA